MTSRASKSPHSIERKKEAAERLWSDHLSMWYLCANAACRRARCCRGNASTCFRQNFPRLPAGVREWFLGLGAAPAEGLSFDEAFDFLTEEGLQEFDNWCAAVERDHGAVSA